MSSVPGGLWNENDFISFARLNRVTKINLTGDEIAALPSGSRMPNMILTCTANGSGFIKDVTYYRDTDDTTWTGLSVSKHMHDSNSDQSGGPLQDIFYANTSQVLWLNKTHVTAAQLYQLSAGGSVADDYTNARVTLNTGVVAGNYAHVASGGTKMSFSAKSRWQAKAYATANTQLTIRMGVGIEHVNAANDTLRKYCIEACDSAGTARNYDLITADTSSRTSLPTVENVLQTSPRAYRMDFTPATDVKFWVNNVLRGTKSTSMPATSTTGDQNVAGFGIRTNNTTSKTLNLYGFTLVGTLSDSAFI